MVCAVEGAGGGKDRRIGGNAYRGQGIDLYLP